MMNTFEATATRDDGVNIVVWVTKDERLTFERCSIPALKKAGYLAKMVEGD